MKIVLTLENHKTRFFPVVADGVIWQTALSGSPGILRFALVPDPALELSEGNRVVLKVDGKPVFSGFLFRWEYSNDGLISAVAYDQIRYLKNKDSYVFTRMTATDMLRKIAGDFQLKTGALEDTKYTIESYSADCMTLNDIIEGALALTREKTNKNFVLFDDCGALCLKNSDDMVSNILIDQKCGSGYRCSSSIDGDTFNKVKLIYNNKRKQIRDTFVEKNEASIKDWGVLQYCKPISDLNGAKEHASALLKAGNQRTKTMALEGVFGDVRIRAGYTVRVVLQDDVLSLKEWMLCDTVKHRFCADGHTMDITLKGRRIV